MGHGEAEKAKAHAHGSHGHSHGHGHAHGGAVNAQAAFIRALGDLVENVGLIVTAIVIHVKPAWTNADTICSLCFCIIRIVVSGKLVQYIWRAMQIPDAKVNPVQGSRSERSPLID